MVPRGMDLLGFFRSPDKPTPGGHPGKGRKYNGKNKKKLSSYHPFCRCKVKMLCVAPYSVLPKEKQHQGNNQNGHHYIKGFHAHCCSLFQDQNSQSDHGRNADYLPGKQQIEAV